MLHIMQFSELLLQNFNYYEVSCMCRSVTMEGGHHQTVLMWLVEAPSKHTEILCLPVTVQSGNTKQCQRLDQGFATVLITLDLSHDSATCVTAT